MSVILMTAAWKSDYQSGKKMVLLALCDNSNDQGECFPSIPMLAEKCSLSRRAVFVHVSSLEADGAIKRETRPGRSTIYHLDPCRFCTPVAHQEEPKPVQILHPTGADSAPLPVQPMHPARADSAPTRAAAAPITITQSSRNHQKTKRASPFDAGSIELPEWMDSDSWQRWVRDRKARGKSITEDAAKLQLKALATYRRDGFTVCEVIENSIASGYQGLFPPKRNGKSSTTGRHAGFRELDYTEGVTDGIPDA